MTRTLTRGLLLAAVAVALCLPAAALADVPVDPSYWTGPNNVRDIPSPPGTGGITASNPWDDGFSVTWDIYYGPGNAYLIYNYTFTVADKGFSHIILEVSADAPRGDFWDFSWTDIEGPRTFSPDDPGASNPGMPGDIYGIKFDNLDDVLTFSVSFKSTHLPMWGDFYAKDGKDNQLDVFAFNTGFGTDPTNGDYTNWIPVPDTLVPVPGSVILLGSGLLGLVGLRFRRK